MHKNIMFNITRTIKIKNKLNNIGEKKKDTPI